MADFATYSALSGKRDWGQIRQDRLLQSQFIQQMQQDLQNRIDKESKARQGVQEYINAVQQAQVLDVDAEKAKAAEKSARQVVIDGLKNAGGNYQKFILGNGVSVLNEYYGKFKDSKEMQNAAANKIAFAQNGLDEYLGREARPIIDAQGNELTFKEQLQQLQDGKIDRLQYNGSVKPIEFINIQDAIQKTFGKNPHVRQKATDVDVFNYAKALGAEDWQAKKISEGYKQNISSGGTPVYFNFKEQSGGGSSDYMSKYINALFKQNSPNILLNALNGQFSEPTVEIIGGADKTSTVVKKIGGAAGSIVNNKEKAKQSLNSIDNNPDRTEIYYTDLSSTPDLKNSIIAMGKLQPVKDDDGNIVSYTSDINGKGVKMFGDISLVGAEIDPSSAKIATVTKYKNGNPVPYIAPDNVQQFNGQPYMRVTVSYDNKEDAYAANALGTKPISGFGYVRAMVNPNLGLASMESRGETVPGGVNSPIEEGNFKYKNGKYTGDVLIPLDVSFLSQSFNQPKQTVETNFSELIKAQMYQQMQEAGAEDDAEDILR